MSKSSLAIYPDSVVMRESIRQGQRSRTGSAAAPRTFIGEWELRTAENGDLVAIHTDGTTKTIATVEEGS